MKNNFTGEVCTSCGSHLMIINDDYECSYCGLVPEDFSFSSDLDEEEEEDDY